MAEYQYHHGEEIMSSTKSTRRILCVIAAFVFAFFTLAGCGDDVRTPEHEHVYDGDKCTICGDERAHEHTFDENKWSSDANSHWHPATCAHSNQMKGKDGHTFDAAGEVCTVCGYKKPATVTHTHTFDEETWTDDAYEHWHPATCEHTAEKSGVAYHSFDEDSDACNVCGSTAHVHKYNVNLWLSDVYEHWHPATCSHSNQHGERAEHDFGDGESECLVCGEEYHEHTFDTSKRLSDENYHWYNVTCEHAGIKGNMAPHIYRENSNACVYCGYKNTNLKPVEPEQPAVIKPFANTYDTSYTPTTFKKSTVKSTVTNLGPGVNMVKTTYTLTSTSTNRNTAVWTIEVELDKANVVAGTRNNSPSLTGKTTPYAQATAWESANAGGHVYSSLNADFFSGNNPVNAFVKDGVIVQDGHLDWSGIYDYKNTSADVPASAPMLFGVKGTKAQIAPIIKYTGDPTNAAVKQQLIKAKLTYVTRNKIEGVVNEYDKVVENAEPSSSKVAFINSGTGIYVKKGALVLKVDLSGGKSRMKVVEKKVVTSNRERFTPSADRFGYFIALPINVQGFEYYNVAEAGDYILYGETSIKSPDGTWDGYETILGTRQALIIDGNIPATVKLENTNGAQSRGIPRSAVGIKEGRVVIFAVEGLRYSGKSSSSSDPYGMNLPELADFMKYYGIEVGGNFDGGGSTKLITKAAGGSAVTQVRSSDYGTSTVSGNARSVVNSILVVNRPSK